MSKFAAVFGVALGFAILSTTLLGLHILAGVNSRAPLSLNQASTVQSGTSGSLHTTSVTAAQTPLQQVFQSLQDDSLAFAPSGWFLVGGLWMWRGRVRSRWESLGFDSEVFELFVRMKGGRTRRRLLDSLLMPKDRLQLAQELGMDWKAIDRHIVKLNQYGFVHEQAAYGRVRMYELTTVGKMLLQLLKETSDEARESVVSSFTADHAAP